MGIYDRALIVLTSDHGESLLDEPGWDGENQWGHNRVLANNLAIPLWIKLPGQRGAGRDVDDVVGLVDLRATLAGALGIELGESRGIDILKPRAAPREPVRFASSRRERGFVLSDGDICAWKRPKDQGTELQRVFHAGAWSSSDLSLLSKCRAEPAASSTDRKPLTPRDVDPQLYEELRALGYLE